MIKLKVFAVIILASIQSLIAQKAPQLGKDSLDEVINAMTAEEKADLLIGPGRRGYAGLTSAEGKPPERVPGAAGGTKAIPRLGIPRMVFADGPAGLRIQPHREDDKNTYYATAFPVGTSLASTWNTKLIEDVGVAIGEEVKEYGVDVLLAPALNLHRNPLNGRNFEYYSEDPLVGGKIAGAYIRGVQSNEVGTSIKHFAANNQETNRLKLNAHITERAMREIYLRGFEIAIKEASPWTVMSAYNKINGIYASSSQDLLNTVLRDEWGYDGFVMTDWYGGYPGFHAIRQEGVVSEVVAQVESGNDLMMPGLEIQHQKLKEAIIEGEVDVKALNESVKRILSIILKSPAFKGYDYTNDPNLKANAEVTRQVAAEGMVLLQNKGEVLPYQEKTAPIAVFGNTSYNFISGGTGSGDVNEAYSVSLIEGLKNAGYKIHQELEEEYGPFVKAAVEKENERREKEGSILASVQRISEMPLSKKDVEEKAKSSGVAVITIGRNSGEQHDRNIDEDFYLAQDEVKLINQVSEAFHAENKKVIVILNIGGVIETNSWKDKVDAILLAWQPGQEGGNSVADIFSGKVNPSGKLTMTFPVDYNNHASAAYWLGVPKNDPEEVMYKEGVYVGYRYFNTFGIKPSYEFGFGNSYTSFEYSDLQLNSKNFRENLEVSIKITNSGNVAGKEVVQLYVSAPANLVDKPSEELVAFAKTRELEPGGSEVLKFTISGKDISSFVDDRSAWIAEKGTYRLKAAASSLDVRLEEEFTVSSDIIVEKVNNTFDLEVDMNELKN